MSITLQRLATTIELPDDLDWTDEFAWQPVQQTSTYTSTGALILETGVRQAGRPITLAADDNRAWMPRETCALLQSWAETPLQAMTLTIRGIPVEVAWRYDPAAVQARPVIAWANADLADADPYVATLRFITL